MSSSLDYADRRSRLHPLPTGKRVWPQERDLLWFAKLNEHGPLPTSFLLAFSHGLGRSEKRARERLTDLFNEDCTPDCGAYLTRPPQQFRTLDARYNQLVHDLAPAGRRALARLGPAVPVSAAPSGPWLHRFMTSCITASIELATLARDDLAYIPQSSILARAAATLRCPVAIADPSTGRESVKTLAPDSLFGLEYKTPAGSRFRFFAVEADRATEPASSTNWNRKSLERSLSQYEAYVAGGAYREHLGLEAPLMVLNVFSDVDRLERALTVISKRHPMGNSFMLLRAWPAFGTIFRPPKPHVELLAEGWRRTGLCDFRIDEP